jgi:hypothetical protein
MFKIWAAISIFMLSQHSGLAACEPNATLVEIQEAKAAAKEKTTEALVSEYDYVKIDVRGDDGSVLKYYFTEPSHPAHPAYVLTTIYESDGKVMMRSRGFTAGDCEIFKLWLQQFAAQHQKVQGQLKENDT